MHMVASQAAFKIFPKEGKRVYARTVWKVSAQLLLSAEVRMNIQLFYFGLSNHPRRAQPLELQLEFNGPSFQTDCTVATTMRTGQRMLLRPALPVRAANLVHTYF